MSAAVGYIANINAFVGGALSVCLNGFLIFTILKSKSTTTGYYKWIIMSSAAFDLTFSILTAFACPTIAAVGNYSSVLFVKGGIFVPFLYGRILLVIWIILLCTNIIISPSQFIFQYLQICRSQWMTIYGQRSFFIFLIPFFLAWSAAAMLIISAYPDEADLAFFNDIASHINLNEHRAYLVACLRPKNDTNDEVRSYILLVYCVYIVCILLSSLFAMLICSRRILVTVKRASSVRSAALQKQVLNTLVVQFIVPFLFIQIPFCACCLAPLFHLETDEISNYLPFLFAWSPALNPIAVMYFVKDLRPSRRLFSSLKEHADDISADVESKFVVGNGQFETDVARSVPLTLMRDAFRYSAMMPCSSSTKPQLTVGLILSSFSTLDRVIIDYFVTFFVFLALVRFEACTHL